jgi:hypothetical protein
VRIVVRAEPRGWRLKMTAPVMDEGPTSGREPRYAARLISATAERCRTTAGQ